MPHPHLRLPHRHHSLLHHCPIPPPFDARSLNGEGNFNWRLKFKFLYYPAEEKLVVRSLVLLT